MKTARDCGWNNKNSQGLLKKTASERVSSIINRRIPIERLRLLPTELRPAGRQSQARRGGAIEGLAGALGSLAPVHQNAKEKLR
jgi:hypothetical protein